MANCTRCKRYVDKFCAVSGNKFECLDAKECRSNIPIKKNLLLKQNHEKFRYVYGYPVEDLVFLKYYDDNLDKYVTCDDYTCEEYADIEDLGSFLYEADKVYYLKHRPNVKFTISKHPAEHLFEFY